MNAVFSRGAVDPEPPRLCAASALSSVRLAFIMAAFVSVAFTAASARYCLEHGLAWPCVVRTLFHIPCPACGSTRALAALALFDLPAAFFFNPLLILSLPIAFLSPFVRRPPSFVRRFGWFLVGGAVLLNWFYLLWNLPR